MSKQKKQHKEKSTKKSINSKSEYTTIRISKKIKEVLRDYAMYSRETDNDVLARLIMKYKERRND